MVLLSLQCGGAENAARHSRNQTDIFLSSIGVWNCNFLGYAEKVSTALKEHAQAWSAKQGRPYEYVESSRASKEEIAVAIAAAMGSRRDWSAF